MSNARKYIKGHEVGVLTGRRKRQETFLSIRKAKKEDMYAIRRNLKANRPNAFDATDDEHSSSTIGTNSTNDRASRKELLDNIAIRSQSLVLGIQHSDLKTQQKSVRGFVYLLSSGVPPLFDETDSQHVALWETIISAIPYFLKVIQEPIADTQHLEIHSDAAFALRFIASMEKASVLVQLGALPCLIQLFQSGISELQIQAAWCLGNIASESAECCTNVMQHLSPLCVLPHIRMATASLRRASVWLLRNLIEYPDVLQECDGLPDPVKYELLDVLCSIIDQLAREKLSAVQMNTGANDASHKREIVPAIAPWRFFEVSTGKPSPNDVAIVRFLREINDELIEVMDVDVNFETGENMVFQAKRSILKPVSIVDDSVGSDENDFDEEDPELADEKVLTLCDTCWSLVELSLQDSDTVEPIVRTGLCSRLIELLYIFQSSVILSPVLRLLGNIVSAEITSCQAVIDANILSVMPLVLSNISCSVREEACWMLSNIAGGQEEQAHALLKAPSVLSCLVEQMSWAEYRVRREATWAICNVIVHTNSDSIEELAQVGVFQPFNGMLDEWEDPLLSMVMLEAFESLLIKDTERGRILLEESHCLGKLEELCYDANTDVSAMASSLMDSYFSEATEERVATEQSDGIVGETLAFGGVNSEMEFKF